MSKRRLVERQTICESKEQMSPTRKEEPQYLLALLSMLALMCSGLELELLISLDAMRQYMTFGEILWDASAALLLLAALVTSWWLCLLLALKITDVFPQMRPHSTAIFWRVALVVPGSYFTVVFLNAVRLRIAASWRPGPFAWLWIAPALVASCTLGVCIPDLSAVQRFCRARLAPVGWLHALLIATSVVALWRHGVYPFRDFVRPGTEFVASNLPDIYLITIDALAAEDMSLYGYTRETTPNLERFATHAFTFNFFFANSNFTDSATTSIETGTLPWTHRVFHQGGFLRGPVQRESLATLLQKRGYYTAAISGNYFASPIHHRTEASYSAVEYIPPQNASGVWDRQTNLVGLNTVYTLSSSLFKPLTILRTYLDAFLWSSRCASPAEPVINRARLVIQRQDVRQPRFVWTHILPPHDPYMVPRPYRGRFLAGDKLTRNYNFLGLRMDATPAGVSVAELRARYDEYVLYTDHVVGDYLNWLDDTGRLDHSIVIITADHGESFEHNWLTHGGQELYNGVIRIPLLIHLPGQTQDFRITQAAEEVDLVPTIVDLIGGQAPSWSEGTSLKPALEGKDVPQRLLYSMNLEPGSAFEPIRQGTVAVLDGDFKYIDHLGTQEASLYRYRTDPLEEKNLVESEPAVAARMKALLANELKEVNSRPFVAQ